MNLEDDSSVALRRTQSDLRELLGRLDAVDRDLSLAGVHPSWEAGRRNLEHYVNLRRLDLRPLQHRLAEVGLSSLNSMEAHARPALEAALRAVTALLGEEPWRGPLPRPPRLDDSMRLLEPHAAALLGTGKPDSHVRIMVTLGTEHAHDGASVGALVAAGMDVARINCAHDAAEEWRSMAARVREAARARDRAVRVEVDLGGPKVRTGPMPDGKPPRLHLGDRFRLMRHDRMGRGASPATEDTSALPACVGCTSVEAMREVAVGQRVRLDDGKLEAIVRGVDAEGLDLEVTHARAKGFKLKADRGINFPDAPGALAALTERDRRDLTVVVEIADIVGLSFCQSGADVRALRAALRELGHPDLGVIAKIETRRAFEALPEILVALMEGPAAGLMIARGDLAVEVGYERIAEVQEEILWLCEAAHMPVIWATQVLESMAKEGIPSRAEITDAAMGERAECVMLNKGPFVCEAVVALNDILHRMEGHQRKKATVLRPLRSFGR